MDTVRADERQICAKAKADLEQGIAKDCEVLFHINKQSPDIAGNNMRIGIGKQSHDISGSVHVAAGHNKPQQPAKETMQDRERAQREEGEKGEKKERREERVKEERRRKEGKPRKKSTGRLRRT